MNEIFMYVGPCALFAAMVMILAYWACRAIDYHFRRKENLADYDHDVEMQALASVDEDRRQERYLATGYQYQKQLIQSGCDRVRNLSMDVVREINQKRLDLFKDVMSEVPNMMKTMTRQLYQMEMEEDEKD